MNLKQAVESGKRFKLPEWKMWWCKNDMVGASGLLDDAIRDDWMIEPEVYEVECEWYQGNISVIPSDIKGDFNWAKLIGKRTKLRIEVWDEMAHRCFFVVAILD